MSQGDPQHTASSGMDIKPASTSNEALVMATTRNIFKSPSPTLHIRGTHKTASEGQERCTDFDLALETPDRTLLKSLKMDGISYDTHDMGGIQDQIRTLYNSLQGDTKVDHNVVLRLRVTCHLADEQVTQSSVIALCRAVQYAGQVEIVMANGHTVTDITIPNESPEGLANEIHIVETTWFIYWPLSSLPQDHPDRHNQLQLWRRRIGDAMINGEQGVIDLDTMQHRSGKSLLRSAIAQRNLAVPVSQRVDEGGITWTVSKTAQWGLDETRENIV